MENTKGTNAEPAVEKKLTSRKFWIAQEVMALSIGVPALFMKLGIADTITLTVIGVIGSIGATYGVVNTLEKKWKS